MKTDRATEVIWSCAGLLDFPENWKDRWPKEVLALGITSEIYLLECVLWVGVAIMTSELR
jgi:hypothetical protein